MPRKRPPEGDIRRAVGALIRARRHAAGLTQIELANAIGMHPNTAMAYEQGMREPDIEGWIRIAHACGMALSAFLSPLDDLRADPLPEDTTIYDARRRREHDAQQRGQRAAAVSAAPTDARGSQEEADRGDGDG